MYNQKRYENQWLVDCQTTWVCPQMHPLCASTSRAVNTLLHWRKTCLFPVNGTWARSNIIKKYIWWGFFHTHGVNGIWANRVDTASSEPCSLRFDCFPRRGAGRMEACSPAWHLARYAGGHRGMQNDAEQSRVIQRDAAISRKRQVLTGNRHSIGWPPREKGHSVWCGTCSCHRPRLAPSVWWKPKLWGRAGRTVVWGRCSHAVQEENL